MTLSSLTNQQPFLPINQTFSEDPKQLLIQMTNRDRDISRYVNVREIALFNQVETPTGQQWPNPNNLQVTRNGFRKMFFFSDATLTFAHNISGIVLCTHIWGTGTDGTNFFPIPYVSATSVTNQIQIDVTPTQVIITKGAGAPPTISNGVVVLEYLRN